MKNAKKSRTNKLILTMVLVMFLISVAGVVFEYNGIGGSDKEIAISVKEGQTAGSVAESLKDSGVIASETFFKIYVKISGKGGDFRVGTHKIRANMSYPQISETLSELASAEATVTVPEGFEMRQIADRLEQLGVVSKQDFLAVKADSFDYDFLQGLPDREFGLEGYLFPETYFFSKNESAETVIKTMLDEFDKVFTNQYKERAKELGMTVDQVVTLASIIQREAQNEEEMARVSSVFHNRMKNADYPYLQSCATVQYILKERKSVLSIEDTKIKSPYNTYINKGLPIGPIASPGKAAIEAALYPENTEFLFFVLNPKTNKHVFTKTYEEHLAVTNGG